MLAVASMPLLFEIYERGRRLTDYRVRDAYAVGPESVATPGRVSFDRGLLRVDVGDDTQLVSDAHGDPADAAGDWANWAAAAALGVSLLWDCGPAGEYLLETTRLPPRALPYVLNVELARHRVMRLLQKQEDWNLWELPAAADAVKLAKQAQMQFAEALALLHDRPAAASAADEALSMAVVAGERLAKVHADLLLQRRRRGGVPRSLFGVRADVVPPASPGEVDTGSAAYRAALIRHVDCVNVPIPWKLMQPEEELYDTAAVDGTVEFLARARVPTVAGPLVDLGEGQVPEWLFIYEHDFEAVRDAAFGYVRAAVSRYRRVVKLWNVVAGLHAPGGFSLSFEQMIELTRLLVSQVKVVQPQAKTLVTIRQPFGEYLASHVGGEATSVPPMLYAEMVAQSGVQVDGFGVELLVGRPSRGAGSRDLFQMAAMLDRFATLGKPLFVTACACPGEATLSGGRWRAGNWDRAKQAQWLNDVLQLAISRPYVENVAWADLADAPGNIVPAGGLLSSGLQPKPAVETLTKLRNELRTSVRTTRTATSQQPGQPPLQPTSPAGTRF
jgi:hypothetical protein